MVEGAVFFVEGAHRVDDEATLFEPMHEGIAEGNELGVFLVYVRCELADRAPPLRLELVACTGEDVQFLFVLQTELELNVEHRLVDDPSGFIGACERFFLVEDTDGVLNFGEQGRELLNVHSLHRGLEVIVAEGACEVHAFPD